MNFKKWVKSIQTAGYNGARTVIRMLTQINFLKSFPFIKKGLNKLNVSCTYYLDRKKNKNFFPDLFIAYVDKFLQIIC